MIATTTNRGREWAKAKAGFSLIELLVVIAIILIIAAIAIPNLLRSRMAAHEAAAAEDLRAMTTAATVYSSTWGNGYPPNLGALGGIAVAATCDQAQLLNTLMTTTPFQEFGYTFSYTGTGPALPVVVAGCSAPGYNSYLVAAAPTTPGVTGIRSFCSTTPGVIHYDVTGSVIASTAACNVLPVLQ
ncbi:MAG: prepilin-type N-terminal cleavage/methylation domain-containing protein [Candidatus Acidiferrales bacterium]